MKSNSTLARNYKDLWVSQMFSRPSPTYLSKLKVQHTAYSIQHTAYSIQHTVYSMLLNGLQFFSCLLLLASKVSSTSVSENATVRAHLRQLYHLFYLIRKLNHEQYDDLTYTPLVESPVGSYKFLNYTSWVVAGQLTAGIAVGGVASKSGSNSALTALDVQTENGATPTMTIEKPYNSFRLLDFYFGCVLRTDEATANEATP